MDGVAHLPQTHLAGEVLDIHSANDAAITFPRGATPCAKSIPTQAGQTEAHPHPPSDPAPHSHTKAARGYPCTHVRTPEPPEARPKKTIPTDKERRAPKTRRYQSAHTWQPELARWQSIIPRTQKPTQARAWWQSIPSAAISGPPLPPTDPRESCGMPVAGRRSAGTSAGVHPSETSHASAATCNHCAKRAQREARRRGPALQQAPDAELSLLSKETERSGHLPHGGVDGNMPAQPAPRRRAVGSSKGKIKRK